MLNYKTWLAVALSILFLVAGSLIHPVNAGTTEAISYLSNQQQTNGSYVSPDSISTDFQSTSETIRTFNFTGESNQPGISSAHIFLNATETRNTEYLSRLLVLAAQAGENTQVLVAELLQHQNNDGGFGDLGGFDSAVLDTAFALEAIALSGQQPAGLANTVAYLLARQTAEGAWADGSNEPSVYLSALAMRALWHYRAVFSDVTTALANAQNFLLSKRNAATGLWFETHESALALIALVPNIGEFSQLESILTDLRNQQLNDGSWDGDAYVTALVLRALASQPTPQPLVITTGNITGRVLNSVTKQPVANTSVSINSLSLTVTTDSAGGFVFNGLDPSSYGLSVNAAGYSLISFSSVLVTVGVDTSLGDVLLSPLPTSGVLQGRVTDAATKQALAGVLISVSGSSVASTSTAANGSYTIVGLVPGTVKITLAKEGYLPVAANANIVAGGTLVLNPALTATSSATEPLSGTVATGLLRGRVTDASTGLPLSFAFVRVSSVGTTLSVRSVSTSIDGTYEIADLEAGDVTIQITKTGYLQASASAAVSAGNALVFSPGLVPEGGDPASGTGEDVDQEALPGTSITGALQGIATDLETALPLLGVAINVTGSTTASTTTAADGSYSISGISPGDITVTASLNTYVSVSATASVVAGNAIVFNPQLPPDSFVSGEVGSIIGQLVEAGTQNPLRSVVVSAVGTVGIRSVSTASNGGFELADLPPDDYTVTFEKSGYVTQGFNAVITSGGTVDFQTIEMSLALSQIAVFGQLTDIDSGMPIANAVVSVSGTVLSAQTDAQGNYRLEGLDIGSKTLIFSATGYNSQTLIFNFAQGGEFEINRRLGLSANAGVDITFLSTSQASYAAYTPAVIQASVINNGSPAEAMAVFSLFNAQNKQVAEYMGAIPGSSDTLIAFPSSVITNESVEKPIFSSPIL
ncbi:MAG: carboxypeptidase regulatory-like domain-containing protein [Gammaproteobacteria bacterium]|nr:carboxypeptidase regulatory-like domain-containing protein [Gammaproteobacteria bacterium]